MSAITTTQNSNAIFVKFHFELKDAFRALFKNVIWNPGSKLWEIKNIPANNKKLQQFIDASSAAAEALELSDNIEATQAELDELQSKLAKLDAARTAAAERKALFAELNAQLALAKAKYAVEHAEVKKAHNDSLEEKKAFSLVVDEALASQNVPALIKRLSQLWNEAPSTKGREECVDIKVDLESAYDAIKESHNLDLATIFEISELRYNKKASSSPADMYANVYAEAVVIA